MHVQKKNKTKNKLKMKTKWNKKGKIAIEGWTCFAQDGMSIEE